jgi:hypothetical protein
VRSEVEYSEFEVNFSNKSSRENKKSAKELNMHEAAIEV